MANIFLTAQEVAQMLKLNIMTIYEYIREGKLKAIKFGRNYRILFKDFEKFIDDQRVKTDEDGM
jgi:excisionase family DNA binding protein